MFFFDEQPRIADKSDFQFMHPSHQTHRVNEFRVLADLSWDRHVFYHRFPELAFHIRNLLHFRFQFVLDLRRQFAGLLDELDQLVKGIVPLHRVFLLCLRCVLGLKPGIETAIHSPRTRKIWQFNIDMTKKAPMSRRKNASARNIAGGWNRESCRNVFESKNRGEFPNNWHSGVCKLRYPFLYRTVRRKPGLEPVPEFCTGADY